MGRNGETPLSPDELGTLSARMSTDWRFDAARRRFSRRLMRDFTDGDVQGTGVGNTIRA